MVELKDCQQKEMEDKLIVSHTPDYDGTVSVAIWILVLVSCWIQFHLPS